MGARPSRTPRRSVPGTDTRLDAGTSADTRVGKGAGAGAGAGKRTGTRTDTTGGGGGGGGGTDTLTNKGTETGLGAGEGAGSSVAQAQQQAQAQLKNTAGRGTSGHTQMPRREHWHARARTGTDAAFICAIALYLRE